MEVYFVIGESSIRPDNIYRIFLKDKIVCVLADENPFWNMDLSDFSGKIIAYWPEKDPLFKHITNRVREIRRIYKICSLELLPKCLERYDKIYLPVDNWAATYLYLSYKVSKKLGDDKIRYVLIERVGFGGLTEFAALRYISLEKETIVYTTRKGKDWIRKIMELTGAQTVPFKIRLIEDILR